MTRLADRGICLVLLDIEGTTTPLAFVHQHLFPYARTRLASYLASPDDPAGAAEAARELRAEYEADRAGADQPPAWGAGGTTAEIAEYAAWLMDRDRKSPGLKRLQGLIWNRGYQAGELRGEVFDDVPRAITRWHGEGVGVAIYSSGSELAQRRLFASTPAGDLTPLIRGFFDTRVGGKKEPGSYGAIARVLDVRPRAILFVSDVAAELAAARKAGLDVVLAIRPGNAPEPEASGFPAIHSFDEI